jgi:VanZ family protein
MQLFLPAKDQSIQDLLYQTSGTNINIKSLVLN